MSLVGTYVGDRYTLTIKDTDNSTGNFTGTVSEGGRDYKANGHYHFVGGSQKSTILSINAVYAPNSKERIYAAWVGFAEGKEFKSLNVSGFSSTVTHPEVQRIDGTNVTTFRKQ